MADNKPELNEALLRALHEMGESATPEQLTASGVTRVRKVSREMVSKLIEKAVNRTLMGRTIGVSQPELRELVSKAHDEFNRIVGQQDEIDKTRQQIGVQRTALKEELVRIRAELAARNGFVEMREARGRDELETQENEDLAVAIRTAFDRTEVSTPEIRHVEREMIVLVLAALEAARISAFEAGRDRANERAQVLERRVAKLVQSLELTEHALKRVSAESQSAQGIESIYRSVQGLSVEEEDAEAKRALMASIFEKNLELYRRRKAAEAARSAG